MLLTDLREVKIILEIDPEDDSEDLKLNFFIEYASKWIEEYLNRAGELVYGSRTEYYPGTGTQKLLLRARPVFVSPTITVSVDERGYYGSTSGAFTQEYSTLTYGQGFCLDTLDGVSSRSGILVRIGAFWPKPMVRQVGYLSPFVGESFGNVKVTYTGGYTVDSMPAEFRLACTTLVARMRYLFPIGMAIGSESYEERAITFIEEKRDYLMGLAKPLLTTRRNWKW